MSNHIYHDLQIKASSKEVFAAVSEPEHLNNWWTLRCTGTPKLGEEYNLYFAPEYNWYAKVSEVKENQSFHLKMTSADPDWTPTTFGFELEENDKGVLLKFSHMNWPELNHHFRHSSFCWAVLLGYLKNYVEKGVIVAFEDRE